MSDLESGAVTETTIEISWIQNNGGLCTATSDIQLFSVVEDKAGMLMTISMIGLNTTNYVIMGLYPFTYYNISLSVRDHIGAKVSVFIMQRTLSLGEYILMRPPIDIQFNIYDIKKYPYAQFQPD